MHHDYVETCTPKSSAPPSFLPQQDICTCQLYIAQFENKMKVVALLSGGKDSCYTLFKAKLYEHEIVALAHITPPRDEADSFMYQSVGSAAIPYIAEALDIPLYTQATHARAEEKAIIYVPTKNDEVEDLVTLLCKVKDAHPDVQAVCAGALWSDYQRLRVESAASRVGLLSLAYLWRREQSDLLDEMIAAGVHAILIKVAAAGLSEKHLGKTLEEMRPTLHRLEERYGSHVCGEGGEYETLVLWMPGFRKRVALKEVEIVRHEDNQIAPVSYLRIGSCSLEELLDDQKVPPPLPMRRIPDPFIFQPCRTDRPIFKTSEVKGAESFPKFSVGKCDRFLQIVARSEKSGGSGVADAAAQLEVALKELNEELGNIIYVILYLSSVSGAGYTAANAGYNKVFGVPECTPPPSRACVGSFAGNPPTTIEALVSKGRDKFDENSFSLHVQSLSEWAPPCIGPYSQLVEEDGVVHVCGVLPLYAPSASILPDMPVGKQVEACVYNLRRTLEASRAEFSDLRFFTVYLVDPTSVDEVAAQLERLIRHERQMVVLLPVSALPKDGLVEMRAVGVTNGEDPSTTDLKFDSEVELAEAGLGCRVMSCENYSFMVIEYTPIYGGRMRIDSAMIGDSVTKQPFGEDANLLSLQVHTTGNTHEMTKHLESLFVETAISVFSCRWLPRDAKFTCIATFITEVEGTSDGTE